MLEGLQDRHKIGNLSVMKPELKNSGLHPLEMSPWKQALIRKARKVNSENDQNPKSPEGDLLTDALGEKKEDDLKANTKRRRRCGECEQCQIPDCGDCYACRDKPKFGGPNKIKQSCRLKICQNMTFGKQSNTCVKKRNIEENRNEINEHNRNAKKARSNENRKSEQIEQNRERVKKEQIEHNNTQPANDGKVDKDTQGKKLPKQTISSTPRPEEFHNSARWNGNLSPFHREWVSVPKTVINQDQHPCKKCPLIFSSFQGLLYHDLEHKRGQVKTLLCLSCNNQFNCADELALHQHYRQCDLCQETTRCRHAHAQHKLTHNQDAHVKASFRGFREVNSEQLMRSVNFNFSVRLEIDSDLSTADKCPISTCADPKECSVLVPNLK